MDAHAPDVANAPRNPPVVRRAGLQDHPDVARLLDEALPNEPYRYADNLAWDESFVLNHVALSEGRLVGYITVLVSPPDPRGHALWQRLPRPYVGCLAVKPSHQRQGIGHRLINATLAALPTLPVAPGLSGHLYLECADALVPVYRRMGFEHLLPAQILALAGMPARANAMRRALPP